MLWSIASIALHVCVSLAIWPQPSHVALGEEVRWLHDNALTVSFHCAGDPAALFSETPPSYRPRLPPGLGHILDYGQLVLESTRRFYDYGQSVLESTRRYYDHQEGSSTAGATVEVNILRDAVTDMLSSPGLSGFVPWKVHPRGSSFEPDPVVPRQYLLSAAIEQRQCPPAGSFDARLFFAGDESYEIRIDSERALIKTNSSLGTVRALQTFAQLFYAHSSTGEGYVNQAPLTIIDKPMWSHRGLSVDIARNPFRPEDLIRTIDIMSTVKLNRLHVHATDSQAWPIEIPALPKLATKGAYHPGLVWTVAELEEIQRYGISKGVSVFIEIDMPGHTAAIAHAYPDLIAAFNELDWSTFALEPLSGQLKLNSEAVTTFVTTLLTDLLPRTSPFTSLYHLGGDEVNLEAYLLDETVRSKDPQVLQPLMQKFFDVVLNLTHRHDFQPIVWEEMLLEWNLTLPQNTLIQVWRHNTERIEEVLRRGHRAIFGDYSYWYLDCGFGQFLDPYPSGSSPPGVPYNTSGGRPSTLSKPYLDYCNPYHNWRHIYTYNPLENVTAALRSGIEGGEVLLWSEQTDSYDLDIKLWPRAAAAAEVLWAGIRNESMIEDASRRLGEWRERIVTQRGYPVGPVHMTWCLMEGGCNL